MVAPRISPSLLAAGLILLSGGCTTSLATMMPARTTPVGHAQASLYGTGSIALGDALETVEAAEDVNGPELDDQEIDKAVRAATVGLIEPPNVGGMFRLSFGVSKYFDFGIKTNGLQLGGFARLQLLRVAPGFYGYLGGGVTRHFQAFPVEDFADELTEADFGKWDFEVPLHFGYSSRVFHIWAGPKVVFSSFEGKYGVCVVTNNERCRERADVGFDGTSAYVGGQLGIAVGYRRFWVALELTMARFGTKSDVRIDRPQMEREERRVDSDGFVISPALGLLLWI